MQQSEKKNGLTEQVDIDQQRRYRLLKNKLLDLKPSYSEANFQPLEQEVLSLMVADLDIDYCLDNLAEKILDTGATLIAGIYTSNIHPDVLQKRLSEIELQLDLAKFFYFLALNGNRVSS